MARQRGDVWQADTLVEGKRVRKSFPTREEAEQFEARHVVVQDMCGPVFADLAIDLWNGTKDEKNCLRISRELAERIGETKRVSQITTLDIDDLVRGLKAQGNKVGTINNKLARLSKLLKRSMRRGLLKEMVEIEFLDETKTGRIRFLTWAEQEAIFSHLPEPYLSYAVFLVETGCRFSEPMQVRWSDIDRRQVVLWDTKGGEPRKVPLTPEAAAVVPWTRESLAQGPFFDMDYHSFRRHWNAAKKRAGLLKDKQVVPHVLRHTCASRLVQAGVDLRRVQKWLGHADIQMTLKYAHLAPDDLFSVIPVVAQFRSRDVVPKGVGTVAQAA